MRLLLFVTFVVYGTQNANSFKLLQKLLAKHLQPDLEGKSLIADGEVYYSPGPYKLDDSSVVEWNGHPVLSDIKSDGTVDGVRSEASADVNAETSSEEEYDNDNSPETSDDKQPDAKDANKPDSSIKHRLCDKVELIKSVINSVKQKVKSAKETTGVDVPDSSFLYENGNDGIPSSTPFADVTKYTTPTVKFTASTPFADVQPMSTLRPDRDGCTADAHGKVVVECYNRPVIVVESSSPPPHTVHYYYYYYYSPLPYRHHQQSWPTNCPPQPDRQIGYDRPNVRYAPYTMNGAAWTLENVPYYVQGRPGDVNGVGQWIGRYGYDEYKPVSPKPAVSYYNDYVVPPQRTDMPGRQQDPAAVYATPSTKPIVAMYSVNVDDTVTTDVRRVLPTTNGDAGSIGEAVMSMSTDGGGGLAGYEYPSSRGDVPLQRDDSIGQIKDVYEHEDAALKERRQVGHDETPFGKTPAVPATASSSSKAPLDVSSKSETSSRPPVNTVSS